MKKSVRIITVVLIILLGVCLGIFIYKKTNIREYVENKRNEHLSNDVVATVADRSITEAEARVYLAAMQSRIESIYGEEVWDYKVDDEGTEYSELMRSSVLDKIIYIKLVCANAEEYGVELTADDRLDVEAYVTDFFAGISEDTAKEYDLTKEMVTKIYEENVLAAKVYDKITLNYTVEANSENCRQARFVIAKINKFSVDTEGNRVYYSEDELAELKNRVNGVYASMKNGDVYQTALSAGSLEEPRVTCGTDYFPTEAAEAAFALADGELSGIIETDESFYIIYCEEDNDVSATEEAIQTKIDTERKAYFNTLYTLWRDSASIEIDEEKWDKIR